MKSFSDTFMDSLTANLGTIFGAAEKLGVFEENSTKLEESKEGELSAVKEDPNLELLEEDEEIRLEEEKLQLEHEARIAQMNAEEEFDVEDTILLEEKTIDEILPEEDH